ncbi:zinc finger protein 518A [Cheilinus undulatus]|uniref:zinc finger protein 518A n=1 Tax=Cheilinus undulatus TaxID=241271 RepID=UPI001BD2E783|nr:zinc finger protein 518A [Cheilinus undulatus]XP_041671523.1 zinc finger protein 518A [Cheilinus undulatus]
MEEEVTLPPDSTKCNLAVPDDEKEKVKDFVFKHFREVTDRSLFSEDLSTKRDRQAVSKAPCKVQQGAVFSGKILSFECSVCKDGYTYSPNDLLKHFRAAHRGTLPTYPCDLCGFFTNEFPALQRHRIEHRNTLVTCELCNDDVQYSLLLLTRHYIMCHSVNGLFSCDWCDFTTVDAGTFVQHIHHHNESPWKCSKCRHISLNEEDHQRHIKAHSGTFPFTCQFCGYGAARSDYLKNHIATVHKDDAEKRKMLKPVEDSITPSSASAALKLLMKKCETQEAPRSSKLNWLSGSLANKNGRIIKPEISVEDCQHSVDGTVGIKDNNNCTKSPPNSEPPAVAQESENSATSDSATHTNPNGLTVLMVKNKISLPPNCTTKVMGFKMVEGKKHLVLKVIPSAKQESSNQNGCLVEDVSSSAPDPVSCKHKATVEYGEGSHRRGPKTNCFSVLPQMMDQDEIMTVKVKIEEEETSVSSLDCTAHGNDEEQTDVPTHADTSHPVTNDSDQSHTETETLDNNPLCGSSDVSQASKTCAVKVTDLSTHLKAFQKNALSEPVTKNTVETSSNPNPFTKKQEETSPNTNPFTKNTIETSPNLNPKPKNTVETSLNPNPFTRNTVEPDRNLDPDTDLEVTDKHKGNLVDPTENEDQGAALENNNIPGKVKTGTTNAVHQNSRNFLINPDLVLESPPSSPGHSTTSSEISPPNQEVFSFHNYSKESFSTSPNTNQTSDRMPRLAADRLNIIKPSKFGLLESVESVENISEDSGVKEDHLRTAVDTDNEVNECTVNDPSSEDENPESVLQDFNIIKIEEESVPVSKHQAETRSQSKAVGGSVEECSAAIISQQPNKDSVGSLAAVKDSLKPTKTTLRILQLPDRKQPVLLRTSENQFTGPLQVKGSQGFKLITNSTNPQINVSYLSPGLERVSNSAPSPINRQMAVSVPKTPEKGTALLSPVQPGIGNSPSHYFINSPGFKGPVLLSSTPHTALTDKTTKTQPTCFLLHRSVPLAQAPSTPGLRLASAHLPLNARPVLAMPMNSPDKPSSLQAGRQAFLLRYISPPKSSLLLNNQDPKAGIPSSQTTESSGNKVIFKIVTPTGSLLTSGAPSSSTQPLFLAARPQTQCFLVSSNKVSANAPNTVKKLISIQNTTQREVKGPILSPAQNLKVPPCEADKPILAPRPIRPPSQRKRRGKTLFDELPETVHKSRRLSNRALSEKETPEFWRPAARDTERTLRLSPFSPLQQVKCPRRYQPVVVLNHPDADIPEVSNIMRVVNRHKGAVSKVSLSQHTVQALSGLAARDKDSVVSGSSYGDDLMPRPVWSCVRERFLLKMKLRKKSRRKYKVVDALSGCRQQSAVFTCWFCGRLFHSQEDWIGHGQRHLMEATRDWNQLF